MAKCNQLTPLPFKGLNSRVDVWMICVLPTVPTNTMTIATQWRRWQFNLKLLNTQQRNDVHHIEEKTFYIKNTTDQPLSSTNWPINIHKGPPIPICSPFRSLVASLSTPSLKYEILCLQLCTSVTVPTLSTVKTHYYLQQAFSSR